MGWMDIKSSWEKLEALGKSIDGVTELMCIGKVKNFKNALLWINWADVAYMKKDELINSICDPEEGELIAGLTQECINHGVHCPGYDIGKIISDQFIEFS